MYFLSILQPFFIVPFFYWGEFKFCDSWFILELRFITVEELFCTAGVLVCFDMFWNVSEHSPRALSFMVVDFFHPRVLPFFYYRGVTGLETWAAHPLVRQWNLCLFQLLKMKQKLLASFFFLFLNWGWKGLVYIMQALTLWATVLAS